VTTKKRFAAGKELSPAGSVAVGVVATVLSVFPPFLLGALSPVVRDELGFDVLGLGIAVASFYLTASATAFLTGQYSLVERIGVRRSLFWGVALGGLSMASMVWFVDDIIGVCFVMAMAGATNGITQPAATLAMARYVPQHRLGLALGVKQAALPASTLLAGIAVGVIAVIGEWQIAFIAGAVLALIFVFLAILTDVPKSGISARPRPIIQVDLITPRFTPLLVRAIITSFLASIASNSMRVFYVESAVNSGESLATAGLLLSIASTTAIITRFVGGWRADYSSRNPMILAGLLMLAGSLGYALSAFFEGTTAIAIAGILGIAGGWGWSGLINLAVVNEQPTQAAAVSAYIHFSTLAGSLVGPVLFGFIITMSSFPVAWAITAVIGLIAALIQLAPLRSPEGPTPALAS
jgi:MFS family permease